MDYKLFKIELGMNCELWMSYEWISFSCENGVYDITSFLNDQFHKNRWPLTHLDIIDKLFIFSMAFDKYLIASQTCSFTSYSRQWMKC
jgi:hypothetical protein